MINFIIIILLIIEGFNSLLTITNKFFKQNLLLPK